MLSLRDYQEFSIEHLRAGFAEGHRSQMLYLPTGGGKTEIAISMMALAAEKGNRVAMVMDRRVLCDQTSKRLDKYGIDHGVLMADHWRYRPDRKIQVCSAQTLEARGSFPGLKLLIIDEAHTMRESIVEFINLHPDVKVIGLSASPFTNGLGNIFSNVVSKTTTNELIDTKQLSPLRVFISKEIDMTGVKKVAGEWSQKDATERGIKITGDIVAEWVQKTYEIFGKPVKTAVFCAGVAHGEDLSRQFAESGYNFVSISYKDDEEYKRQFIEDFARTDTDINGLIATDILTKGWDCSDVQIGISARPFTKSFSSHVQQLGRVMRINEGKDYAVWLCHSGNFLRFRDQWEDLINNGVSKLDDGQEKSKPEPTEGEKEKAKCPKCHALWPKNSDTCSNCGLVRQRKNEVSAVAGEMEELNSSGDDKKEKYTLEYKTDFYAKLLGYAVERGHNPGSAYHRYKEKFGVGPSMKKPAPLAPDDNVRKWIQHQNIKFTKGK